MTGSHTRLAGVIGQPVEHSRSPALHNAAYRALQMDAVYLAFAVAPENVAAALEGARTLGFMGLNVTVPHKVAVLACCSEIDDSARIVGAANTIVFRDGEVAGANTDIAGFGQSLDESLERPAARAVVLGAGGAARAVVAALAARDIRTTVIGRDLERARALLALGAFEAGPWTEPSLQHALGGADLLVDATSIGLRQDEEARLPSRVPFELLEKSGLVMSLVYHREPALLAEARRAGLRGVDGSGMLVYQAARAFTLMTGRSPPLDAMREAMSSYGSHG